MCESQTICVLTVFPCVFIKSVMNIRIIHSVGITPFMPQLVLKPKEILNEKSALIFRKKEMIFPPSHM